MEDDLCDLKVLINEHHTFFLNQRKLCSFSARLKKMVEHEGKKRNSSSELKIMDFPGGPDGFENISRFCYNNGSIPISPSNICTLHCSAILLEMPNLLAQSEAFLDGHFYWTWDDILTSLKSCENNLFHIADSSGLLLKLVSSLVSKISENSDAPLSSATPFPNFPRSSSSSSSSSHKTPDLTKNCNSFSKEWWFDDLTLLPPPIIEMMLKTLGAFGDDNKNLIVTRFLLHYLNKVEPKYKTKCNSLADTAVYGVVLIGRAAFSCRGLFWVLRIVSRFGLSRECRQRLEWVIGLAMDQATLDDLLVSGRDEGIYDVSLVLRLVRVFVSGVEDWGLPVQRLKKVGRLVDKYLGEISPDQGLRVPRFLAVAESLPDSARDCFDGVYRALDMYLESHPTLSSEERTRLCRCLNNEKLTLDACKDLAKNPRIPPGAAIQAMVSQQAKLCKTSSSSDNSTKSSSTTAPKHADISPGDEDDTAMSPDLQDKKEELRVNLQKMQSRVMELEKVCLEMKSQMTKMVRGRAIISRSAHQSSRGATKFC